MYLFRWSFYLLIGGVIWLDSILDSITKHVFVLGIYIDKCNTEIPFGLRDTYDTVLFTTMTASRHSLLFSCGGP